MKKILFAPAIITATLSLCLSIPGWAAEALPAPVPKDTPASIVPATGEKKGPTTSNYDIPESPLRAPTAEVTPEQTEISGPEKTYEVKTAPAKWAQTVAALTPPTTVDGSQGEEAIRTAILTAIKEGNGKVEITGSAVVHVDEFPTIPDGVAINIGPEVSLIMDDATVGDLPAGANAAPAGAGLSMTAASISAITKDSTLPLTANDLKAQIQILQEKLKNAETAQARKEIQTSIRELQKKIQEIRKKNMKSIHKKGLPAIHTQPKKKQRG